MALKLLFKTAILMSVIALTSCGSFSAGDVAVPASAAAVGYLASEATDNPLIGVGAGVGTFVAGKYIQNKWNEDVKKAHEDGYKLGLGDATRRQYEIIQNFQKPQSGGSEKKTFRVYEFPAPLEENGVKLEPGRKVKLRVEE